jgi:transcription initiation factor TFIIB
MSLRDVYETGFDEDDGQSINATECPECTGRLQTDGGETTCSECGLVASEYRIDHAATPRSYEGQRDQRERTGSPITPARHDRGLSSEIGYGTDGHGKHLSAKKRQHLNRLRREHNRARWSSKKERNLAFACMDIARLTSALDLPYSVRERASQFYRDASERDLIQGRSIEAIVAACVYASCRCGGYTRTIEELTEHVKCDQQAMTNSYQVLNRELGVEALVMTPKSLLPRIASLVGVPDDVQHRALDLAAFATECGIANGRKPSGVAGACLYLAGQEYEVSLTQKAVADAAGTSPVTLRKRCTELRDAL